VTKKWFDRRSGRVVIRKRSKHLTSRAQCSGILKAITNTTLKTVDLVDFLLALQARRDSYDVYYEHYSNRRFKKEKLAAYMREQRVIDEVIDHISWGGRVLNVFRDCSKTTGFSTTPGGPLKKIEALMVKRGYAVCKEKEAYSTKSSQCCHGLLNKCMKNGQDVVTFRNGKYKENPSKIPREVHGSLICQKCGRMWNRDFVGAVNIYDIYVARMNECALPRLLGNTGKTKQKISSVSLLQVGVNIPEKPVL